MVTTKKTYQFGIMAEKVVMLFLWLKGYKILAWRFKTRMGEVDIIAKKSNIIIAIEVKARAKKVLIEEVLQEKQMNRIKRAAELFIAKNARFHDHNLRFDFILVGRFFLIKHYRNYF